jgi:hypothetical protein
MRFSPYKYGKRIVHSKAAIAVLASIAGVTAFAFVSFPGQSPTPGIGAGIAQLGAGPGGGASPGVTLGTVPSGSATGGVKHSPSASPSSKRSPSASSVAKSASTGHAASPGGASGAGASQDATSRSPYTWPFSWDSIWNIPIASTASYAPANLTTSGTYEGPSEADYDSVSPSFPVVSLENAEISGTSSGPVSVYGDPSMSADGSLNGCSAFLGTDNATVYQGQTTELTAGGDPSFGGSLDATSGPVNIEGTGITGCHGGSGLSGLGGTLTLADLTQSGPITHALKMELDGYLNYSGANGGFRWPAIEADTGYNDSTSVNYYGGSNSNVQEGSLLALPKSISPSSFSNPTVARIARAMQDYGAYIVDTTATGSYNFSSIITNYNASSQLLSDVCADSAPCGSPSSNSDVISSELDNLFEDLEVVTNDSPATPGGGAIGASRCAPYAPAFTDGSDAPPAVTVATC